MELTACVCHVANRMVVTTRPRYTRKSAPTENERTGIVRLGMKGMVVTLDE